MKPVFFYTDSLHDAKFLLVNIQLYGNKFKTLTMSEMVEFAYTLDKASKFQQIINVLCLAKEKRFVQMCEYQQLAMNMVDVANQAKHYRKTLMIKWF